MTHALLKEKSRSCVNDGYYPERLTRMGQSLRLHPRPSGPQPEVNAGKCSCSRPALQEAAPKRRLRGTSWWLQQAREWGQWRGLCEEDGTGRNCLLAPGISQPRLFSPPALGSSAFALRTRTLEDFPPPIIATSIWGGGLNVHLVLCTHGIFKSLQRPHFTEDA